VRREAIEIKPIMFINDDHWRSRCRLSRSLSAKRFALIFPLGDRYRWDLFVYILGEALHGRGTDKVI
jgi:hypothetical protein